MIAKYAEDLRGVKRQQWQLIGTWTCKWVFFFLIFSRLLQGLVVIISFSAENTSEEAGNTLKLSFKGAEIRYTYFKILKMKTIEEAQPQFYWLYLHHFIQLYCTSLFPLHYLYVKALCKLKLYWRASILTFLKDFDTFVGHQFCYLHRLRAHFSVIHGAFTVIKMTHAKSSEVIERNVAQQKREY